MLLIVCVEGDNDCSFFSRLLTRFKPFDIRDLVLDNHSLGLDWGLQEAAYNILQNRDKICLMNGGNAERANAGHQPSKVRGKICFTNGTDILLLLKGDGDDGASKLFRAETSSSLTSRVDARSLLIIDSDKAKKPHDKILPEMQKMIAKAKEMKFESHLNSEHPLPNTSVLTMTKHSKTMEAWGMTVDSSMEDLFAHIIRKHHLLRRDEGESPDKVFENLRKQKNFSTPDETCGFLFEKTDLETCPRVKSLIDGMCRFVEN